MTKQTITKISKALREGGFSTLVYRSYRILLMKLLPSKTLEYNGVKVREGKKLGFLIPNEDYSDKPNYEKGIVESFEKTLKPGDNVVVIGGGNGVTAVRAKQIVGSEGKVIVYEAAEEMIENIKETSRINSQNIDQLHHAGVGKIKNAWGNTSKSKLISPKDLPNCDVLEMDCEGSELEILENLEVKPRNIIVETHGVLGSPTKEVKEKLRKKDYEVLETNLAEKNQNCEEKDIKVVRAVKSTT